MFTGIVESLGTVADVSDRGADARRLAVATSLPVEDMPAGASIAVDGVCLTLVERAPGRFTADLGPETLARTTLARLAAGDSVHLERPLRMGDALGGHMVSGHVDGTGKLAASRPRGESREIEIDVPAAFAGKGAIIEKGSIAVDGVSLTVNTVKLLDGGGVRFGVTLVPHTLAVTRLGALPPGADVNLETDMIAKHVERLVAVYVERGLRERADRPGEAAR